jgi:DEAD/DEAH box helicase domain-containing protein
VSGSGGPSTVAPWDEVLVGDEIAYRTREPSRAARTVPLPDSLHPGVAEALRRTGITELLAHQLDAWTAAARRDDVIVTTGTASGKSLAFTLPVLDAIARTNTARAMYLYPTKALTQDQARALALLGSPGLRPAIYDGDTPTERRRQIRTHANVVLTNPDMLHVGILPHHDRWGDVLHNLRFIVIDEAHVYRGVFGSHVANVLRRLLRLAALYDAAPQVLLASATIANAGELGAALTGRPVVVVDGDGSAKPERDLVLWNPPLLDAELGLRASALGDASRLLAGLASRGLRTICFAKSRKAAELVHRMAADRVDADIAARLAPYRAGYTSAQRREIERRLVEGDLLGVSATDALELGIDIGLLDCAISVGFPGTVASLRQQWGRAGRRARGLAVLVATDDALDQFFMREPEALLARRVESALLDHANPRILDPHVVAAAYEAPIDDHDASVLGAAALERAAALPELERTPAGFVWKGRDFPAARVSLRSGDGEAFAIVDGSSGALLGLIERERAYSTVHEGAVYLHLGDQYVVSALDLEGRTAVVTEAPPGLGWYTQVKRETTTAVERSLASGHVAGVELHFGHVSVTDQVVAFQRKAIRDGSTLETVPLLLPETTFATEAIWFSPDDVLLDELGRMPALLGTLHATEHALIATLPLWAMCDRWDIGGLSTNIHFQTGLPTIFVYDGHAGGVGIAHRGFERFEEWATDTLRLVSGCPCAAGCPSCVQSPKCGNLNEHLDKRAARTLLRRMIDAA